MEINPEILSVEIVEFRVRYDCLIKEVKTHFFTGLASVWSKFIHKIRREEDLLITLSIVYFQISNTCSVLAGICEYCIVLYVEANPDPLFLLMFVFSGNF